MFIFGGKDCYGAKNKLFVLKIGQKVPEWIEIKNEGPVPCPRYGHTMNYYPNKGILVVFGGRNDENYEMLKTSFLNDIWILWLRDLTWVKWVPKETDYDPEPRYLHCSTNIDGGILVFGGLSENNYCNSVVYVLDIETSIYKLKTRGMANKKNKSVDKKIKSKEIDFTRTGSTSNLKLDLKKINKDIKS